MNTLLYKWGFSLTMGNFVNETCDGYENNLVCKSSKRKCVHVHSTNSRHAHKLHRLDGIRGDTAVSLRTPVPTIMFLAKMFGGEGVFLATQNSKPQVPTKFSFSVWGGGGILGNPKVKVPSPDQFFFGKGGGGEGYSWRPHTQTF